eukprot:COSAG06_NODE_2492_length_6769_cov_2.361619_8_plen_83_part_00
MRTETTLLYSRVLSSSIMFHSSMTEPNSIDMLACLHAARDSRNTTNCDWYPNVELALPENAAWLGDFATAVLGNQDHDNACI